MITFVEIIDLWPSVSVLASDIDEKTNTVSKWRTRKRIPQDKHHDVLQAGIARGFSLTADMIVEASKGVS